MTLKDTERLLKLLRDYGVEDFKTAEVEIHFGESPGAPATFTIKTPEEKVPRGTKSAASAPPVEMEIPHHVNEVQQMLRMSDEDLVNKLFPEAPQPKD